jgi:hypothetical protein
MTSSMLTTSTGGALTSIGSSSFSGFQTTLVVRLDRNNFLLWKTLIIPNLTDQGWMGCLDGSIPIPSKTITTRTGDAVITTPNPDYTTWMLTDLCVLSFLLGSMTEEVLAQMVGHNTSAVVWSVLTSMFADVHLDAHYIIDKNTKKVVMDPMSLAT